MERKLSFILPIYNVEEYLPHCVNSILKQMDSSCEIILVDDGTKDHSDTICDDYAARDERIRVIHKENGGLSSARNAGMDIAAGAYLCFIDSDDYIEEHTVGKLLDWIRDGGADVCFLKTKKVYPDGSEEILNEDLSGDRLKNGGREQSLSHLASRPIYPGSAWAKLWRRGFLEENHFRFPNDRRLSEDLIFCLNAYLKAETMDYLDFPFYCYRQARPGSITSEISPKYFFDSFLFTEEVCSRFSSRRESPEGRLALSAGAYEYMIRLWEAEKLPSRREEAWEKLKAYGWVLSRGCTKKVKLVYGASRLLGLKNTSRLLGIYQDYRSRRGTSEC